MNILWTIESLCLKAGIGKPSRRIYDKLYEHTAKKKAIDAGLIKLFSEFIMPDDLVIDVGVDLGHYSDIFLSLGAKVVGIEPNPELCGGLAKKYQNKNYILIPCALGDQKTIRPIHLCKSHSLSSLSHEYIFSCSRFIAPKYSWDKSYNVQVMTLTELFDLISGKPAFIKIDAEGYEPKILQDLNYAVPALCFEFVRGNIESFRDCITRLETLAHYEYNFTLLDGYKYQLDRWQNSGTLIKYIQAIDNPIMWGDIWCRKII